MQRTFRAKGTLIEHDLTVLWKQKIKRGLFWPYMWSSTFRPQNFRQEVSVWCENLPETLILCKESQKLVYTLC
jgi:hypothetical protein